MKTAMTFFSNLFDRDYHRYEGVRPIQIYLLRLVFTLTFLFVGMDSWSTIVSHEGEWKPLSAVAFSVWAAYSTLSVLGIMKPLKMLPIIAFQIFYKTIWLIIVAYPLWSSGTLHGSDIEPMTKAFLWILLPIVAMPWAYFFRSFIRIRAQRENRSIARID
jgi:hypothetical protein